jgi:hypothetical protein
MTATTPAANATIKIRDIKIGNRFRKDLGDIDSLVKTIQDVGLLQPIGITEDLIVSIFKRAS